MASPAPADGVAEANDATGAAALRQLFDSAGLSGSAPEPPPPPVRPPPGTRVFVTEPPVHLTCPICHDAFKDVRLLVLRSAQRAARSAQLTRYG
jgi:hypothetical protein